MTHRIRIVCAISGRGRTLENLLSAATAADAKYTIVGVISSSANSHGNGVATNAGLPLFVGNFSPGGATATVPRLLPWLAALGPNWVALCGFLKIFPLFPEYQGRVINIHPALLPNYGGPGMFGLHVHAAVLRAGERTSGASVHFVSERYDEGSIIAQVLVPIAPDDSPEALAARVFAAECTLYPQVINSLASGALPLAAGQIKTY